MTSELQVQDVSRTDAPEMSMQTAGLPSLGHCEDLPSPRGLSRRALRLAIDYVETHLGDSLTLDDLACAVGVSRFHFARLFRISMGASPMEYLLRSRIERAKQILRRSEQPLCEIAVSLGFCDQSHFSRAFRRYAGVTPREFARLQRELDEATDAREKARGKPCCENVTGLTW